MRTEVFIDGPFDYVLGGTSNGSTYSVQENATTIDASNYNGGFGQISYTAMCTKDSKFALNRHLTLSDSVQGKVSGVIRSVDIQDNTSVSFLADSVISLLNSYHTSPLISGTMESVFQALIDIVDLPVPLEVVGQDPKAPGMPLNERSLTVLGFEGNLWDKIKEILVAQQVEMALVFNRLVVRPLRYNTATIDRSTNLVESTNTQETAKQVEIYYYQHNYRPDYDQEVYPVRSVEGDPTIYQVDAMEKRTFSVQIDGTMTMVNQPTHVLTAENKDYSGTVGVYSVVGNDDLPITPAQWKGQGGRLQVSLNTAGDEITVEIIGMNNTKLQPYRIAVSSGAGTYYNSLHITGRGITTTKKLLTLDTGATAQATGSTVGTTVDNPAISTLAQAYTAGLVVSGTYAGPNYTLSGTAMGLNRSDLVQDQVFATFSDVNKKFLDDGTPNPTFVDFNATYTPMSMADWNTFWDNRVVSLFSNQAFGQAVGAVIVGSDRKYRIDSTTIGDTGVQFSASDYTLMEDFNDVWAGATMADFDTGTVATTFIEHSMVPLRRNND